ncbi:MAG: choline-sulfatase, partial [Planctomycetota bacterium]
MISIASPAAVLGQQRPNVLVIAIDDLNDWVGCLDGHPQAQTPHIDRLAASGVLFTNAHCQSPLCNPSRTSLMTGLRPTTTGVYGLAPWFRALPEYKDWVTLPQYFMQHGYYTVTTGKVYHGGYGRQERERPEFDEWGIMPGGGKPRPEHRLIRLADPEDEKHWHPLMDWGVFPDRDEQMGDYQVATWAADRITQLAHDEDERPFMMFCGFSRPHVPCFAPQKWFDLYPDNALMMPPVLSNDRDDTPLFSWYLHWKLPEPRLSWLVRAGEWRSLVRSYLACVSFVDAQVGRVLDAVEKNGLSDNTIIVLWSDHG